MNFTSRNLLAQRVVSLGFLAGCLVTPQLWLSDRFFPLTPVAAWFLGFPNPFDRILYATLLVTLACNAALPGRKILSSATLFIAGILALQDQARWHPWFEWYTLAFLVFTVNAWRPTEAEAKSAVQALRLVLMSSYLWSGLQKMNVTFFLNLFPWFVSAFLPGAEEMKWVRSIGVIVPPIEAMVALLLLSPRWRRLGMWGAIGLHAFIFACVGPLGHSVNENVWPWNVTLVVLVWALFRSDEETTPLEFLRPKTVPHALVLALCGFAPILTFFDRFDAYPGFSLYSGSQRTAYIQLPPGEPESVPAPLRPLIDSENRIKLSSWSMAVLKTPDYAEPRIFDSAFEYYCARAPKGGARLVVMSKPHRLKGVRVTDYERECAPTLPAEYSPQPQ